MEILGQFNYWVSIALAMIGLYTVISKGHLIKKLIGLSIFQTSVFLLFITIGKVRGATAPIIDPNFSSYSSPLPHVLILTAIVVSVATLAVGIGLAILIKRTYGSIEDDEIESIDKAEEN
ncbi:MAG: Na+/H+ antiporter subunit C [Rhodospirillaceae bacterium]|nr:Na+/H+ antiporter subunit C [Rhodospirillaceae bacterium]|tara:strand:- start:1025 stop:1384 length:360 start_codon:yes stop_codon:yes gene_type:complete